MTFNLKRTWRATTALCVASTMVITNMAYAAGPGASPANGTDSAAKLATASPVKHVIVLIGENRGLDHTFGIYKPKGKGETISNLLSKGIVKEDGTPGPHFANAQQFSVPAQSSYYVGVTTIQKSPYTPTNLMPQPNTNGAPSAQSDTGAPFKTIAEASVEADIERADLDILTTGATNLSQGVQISDDDYTGDTTHRFYQDYQQEDCRANRSTATNNSGCLNDLFPFVMSGNNSQGNSMGFYNAEQGEVPF